MLGILLALSLTADPVCRDEVQAKLDECYSYWSQQKGDQAKREERAVKQCRVYQREMKLRCGYPEDKEKRYAKR